jgi:two-component system chemotaxis response regulator CheB
MINLSLTDLIQMVCLSRSDIVIRVRSGATDGFICIRKGQVLHAETNTLQGEGAFLEILRWKDGIFEIQSSDSVSSNSIDKPWEHLLLEAMRERDENLDQGSSEVPDDSPDNAQQKTIPLLGAENVAARVDIGADHWEESEPFETTENDVAQSRPESDRIVRVLVVDDSSFFTRQITKLIEHDQDIQVIGTARNGKEAVEFLSSNPSVDVITLDIQMPVMPGDTTLKHIMIRHPIPVLMMSTLNTGQFSKMFEFLQLGAVDFVPKPEMHEDVTEYGFRLRSLIRGAARAEMGCFKRNRKSDPRPTCEQQEDWEAGERVLLFVGGEGAHMEWFRLPLRQLCRQGLVVGVQKIAAPLLPGFVECIREWTGARTLQIDGRTAVEAGAFHLGHAGREIAIRLGREPFSMALEEDPSKPLSWNGGFLRWIERFSAALGKRLSVCFLSGCDPLGEDVLKGLTANDTQLIVPSTTTIVCKQMIQSVESYARGSSIVLTNASYQNLTEVWAKNGCRE